MPESHTHLILTLESPLMAFGGVSVDNHKPTRRFPGASSLVGMIACALGWRRTDRAKHQRLQDRLIFAARIDRQAAGGLPMRDFQTGQLDASDKGWTTSGKPEGRRGSAVSYNSPTLLYNEYIADGRVVVALRFEDEDESPTWVEVAVALLNPARPLFIGRKSCLPTERVLAAVRDGATALDALINTPMVKGLDERLELKLWLGRDDLPIGAPSADADADAPVALLWPEGEGAVDPADIAALRASESGVREYMIADVRNWISGLHSGERMVYEGELPMSMFGRGAADALARMARMGG